ncbi:serine hydrolase domain-containing protein [Sphingobacterium deserti]|uniref:Beta-lactamase n=1 Tax=Sphingobacterium deserti TaxID=1229276 RepID=A0A0B8T037_9SPHI|nr:serine hydrolase [Sphingobacterium deserti]KGE13481.1 beta-lactamase [Sphingobacterium deserti]
MRSILKFLGWTAGVILFVIALAYIFKVDYILKAVRVTYFNGHTTAYLADYEYFDNHTVETSTPQPWAEYPEKIQLPDSMIQFHDREKSVAYVVIHRDSIVLEHYFDGYSRDSKSNSFSMAKSVVAAILGKVIETGKIKSLDQKIIDFVPEIVGPYAKELTFRDLVSMSSGMKWDESYYSPFSIVTQLYFDKDLVGVLPDLPINGKPGQRFSYQSGDTQLLGIAIQRATGASLSDLLAEYFWKPMGAEQKALWQVDSEEKGMEKAYCCLASNALDFARFGKLYRQSGKWNGKQLLSSDYISESLKPRFKNGENYGYSWWLGNFNGKPYFYMDGHLGQFVIVVPEDELIIVRLGHQFNKIPKNTPSSPFYKFIDHAYILLDATAQ